MRFGTLDVDGRDTVVMIAGDELGWCDVRESIQGFDGDLVDLIARFPDGTGGIAPARWQPLAGTRLLAPIPVPRKNIFCIGKNYHAHAREVAGSGFDRANANEVVLPPAPVVFTKPHTTVVGTRADVLSFADVTRQLDYEIELAVVIGRGGRGIAKADAMSHVWGYTIVNDVTARDLQRLPGQWFVGKSLDTSCPMGPWIVTADELDGANLHLRCWINDELRQDANTSDLVFDIPTIVATLSAGMTLHPGDVIATGTPAGVGLGFKPPRFLKSGDVMKLTIDGIGTLINTVR